MLLPDTHRFRNIFKGSIDSFPFCLQTSPSPHPPSPHTPLCGRAGKNMAAVNKGYINTDQQGQYRGKAAGEKCASLADRIAEGKKGKIYIEKCI